MYRHWLILAGVCCALTGCLGKDQTTRSQLDDDGDKSAVRTVGDVSEFQSSGAIPVSGVGLVVGLEGTGGGTPNGPYRQMAEDFLKRSKIDNPREWLDSPNNAVVLVNAEVPVGSRRGDLIHVEVTLPPGSRVKSLRGGYLLETSLTSYASIGQVRGLLEQNDYKPVSTGDGLLKGHVLADAEGPLQIALKDKENRRFLDEKELTESGIKRAWVWKGGRTKADQPYFIVMNPDQQRYRKAMLVAERINETFHGPGSADKVAVSRNADTLVLTTPPAYRSNPPHFLRVVRMIPEQRIEVGSDYFRKLERQLLQPETTLTASLRLEALGRDSIPILTAAMKNSDYPLVRFAAAEALAYLGEPICASELAKLAQDHPTLQTLCLSALASLDEAASSFALQELLTSETAEIRYGAFRALRELDPKADAARGLRLNKSFWVHVVGGKSTPLVHILSNTRAEIVLFGQTPSLVAPFSFRAGPDMVVTARQGDPTITISRFSTRKPQRQEQCSFAVADMIKTMAEMGAQYSDVASLLIQARDTKALNCELAIDALPQAVPVKKLAEAAKLDPRMENEADLLRSTTSDREPAPNVFDRAAKR
jgi:hypothetical protein